MTLINASLLAGVILAGLPILLHLMMRAKPRRIEFPALRLLQTRQTANSRRMRLRHLLLLILRAIVIAVAVLALTRPSLPAARYGLTWYEWLLFAAVIAGAIGIYYWKSRQVAAEGGADHVQKERRGRMRVATLFGGIAAAILFVAFPWGYRLRAEILAPHSAISADIPVAAVFVFDTSLSMTYKNEGLTRLEQAMQMAVSHLGVLRAQSRVAVATTHPESETVFQADLAGVRSRIEDLKPYAIPRSLNAVIKSAIESQVADREQVQAEMGTADSFAREVYLLTDMSEAAWEFPDEAGIRDLLVQHDWLQIYLIDVSVPNANNIALTQMKLDRESTVGGQRVSVSVAVSATAAARPTATVELFMIGQDGEEISGGRVIGSPRQQVEFEGSAPVKVFQIEGDASVPNQRGFVRLASTDPLAFDDIRYFTFGVSAVPRILLVGDRAIDTWYLENAFQPVQAASVGMKRAECKSITPADFAREALANYDIVCVVNWARPDEAAWTEIERFVNNGGALFVTAGGEELLQPGFWSTASAEAVLPGLPLVPVPFRDAPGQLNLVAEDNPICKLFLDNPDARTQLSLALFDRCWTIEPAADSRVLMEFNDRTRRPALIERKVGRGRSLMFLSAMDNNGPNKWNESFVNNNPWAFIMLVQQTMQYLTGATDVKRNYTVGDPVDIAVPAAKRFSQYRVARPRFRLTEGTFPFDESSVLLTDIDEAGHYQLRSADEGISFFADFAANNVDSESNLTSIEDEELTQIIGEERYSRVTNPEQLDRAVNLGRLGVEVFPVLMGLLIFLFCAEHLMANFFYDEEPPTPAKTATVGA